MLEFRFCFFIKKIKIVRDVLILILNVEIFNSRKMYVIIVMKIMERIRCGVYVMKFVDVVIRRLFILKLCFKCGFFYVFYINFIYLFCIFYVFENMCIIYFVMFVKINFFMYLIY